MSRSRLTIIGCRAAVLLIVLILGGREHVSAARPEGGGPQMALNTAPVAPQHLTDGAAGERDSAGLQVRLAARQWTESWDERDPDRPSFDLPLLYLHRQRAVTPEEERTLDIEIVGVPAGSEIQIEAVSRHVDITTGDRHRAKKHVVLPDRPCTSAAPCTLRWTFDADAMHSDFYDLRVRRCTSAMPCIEQWAFDAEAMYRDFNNLRTKGAGEKPARDELDPDRPDFVMLDTWDVDVGAYAVRVTYAKLFPFALGQHDLGNRLPPDEVTDFIAHEFVPIIQETWFTQLHTWGFGVPLHPDWDSDKVVDIIMTHPPFALFAGTGTYSIMAYQDGRPYPQRRIWWFSTNNAFRPYDSLAEAYQVVFAHEFFHLVQWNVLLSSRQALLAQKPLSAGQASAECSTGKWRNFFIEAQGKFVPSVQYPETEIAVNAASDMKSEYLGAANRFLVRRLNSSYHDLEADPTDRYDAALYWRFLYEQYGNMDIIRAALEEMACGYDTDIVQGIGGVMDRAFQSCDGPFRSFEESLTAFAWANYALRLENGRCGDADFTICRGRYYDPQSKYVGPPLEAELIYEGAPLTYAGAVPTSFGMDFIELKTDPAVQGQSLTVRFQGGGEVARFSVQVWQLGSGEKKLRALTPQPDTVAENHDGAHAYRIPRLDTMACDRLALIITRLDPDEATDAVGAYSITVDFLPELGLDSAH